MVLYKSRPNQGDEAGRPAGESKEKKTRGHRKNGEPPFARGGKAGPNTTKMKKAISASPAPVIWEDGYGDEQVHAMWKSLNQCTPEIWNNCVLHTENLIKEWYEREKVLDIAADEFIVPPADGDSTSDKFDSAVNAYFLYILNFPQWNQNKSSRRRLFLQELGLALSLSLIESRAASLNA
ncbi:hypothetical protein QE152_g7685 [Popillia japonica]|uniref:Terminase n=1 Tax=Popillia japonica TaxID=7064 RepID=A0AAW1ME67_POPJA